MRLLRILLALLLVLMICATAFSYYYRHFVKDIAAPVLTTDRDVLEISVEDDDAALFQGLQATDARDGDLTDRIMVDHFSNFYDFGTAKVTYVVFDNSDNYSMLTRTVRYTDYTPPRFRLSAPLVFNVGDTISLQNRLSVYDVLDGDISTNVQIVEHNINSSMPGLYYLTLQVNNSLGDTAVQKLNVLVTTGQLLPEITLKDYLIYQPKGEPFRPMDWLVQAVDPALPEGEQELPAYRVYTVGTVDTGTPGTYLIQYCCRGQNGDATALLTVVVE